MAGTAAAARQRFTSYSNVHEIKMVLPARLVKLVVMDGMPCSPWMCRHTRSRYSYCCQRQWECPVIDNTNRGRR